MYYLCSEKKVLISCVLTYMQKAGFLMTLKDNFCQLCKNLCYVNLLIIFKHLMAFKLFLTILRFHLDKFQWPELSKDLKY